MCNSAVESHAPPTRPFPSTLQVQFSSTVLTISMVNQNFRSDLTFIRKRPKKSIPQVCPLRVVKNLGVASLMCPPSASGNFGEISDGVKKLGQKKRVLVL